MLQFRVDLTDHVFQFAAIRIRFHDLRTSKLRRGYKRQFLLDHIWICLCRRSPNPVPQHFANITFLATDESTRSHITWLIVSDRIYRYDIDPQCRKQFDDGRDGTSIGDFHFFKWNLRATAVPVAVQINCVDRIWVFQQGIQRNQCAHCNSAERAIERPPGHKHRRAPYADSDFNGVVPFSERNEHCSGVTGGGTGGHRGSQRGPRQSPRTPPSTP